MPWSRLLHFRGRAGDLPALISALSGSDSARAVDDLAVRLVHQDGVVQATPFALAAIGEAVRQRRVRVADVYELLRHVERAARHQADAFGPPATPSTLDGLASDPHLLPPFTNDLAEEALMEGWDPDRDQFANWAQITLDLAAELLSRA